MSNFDCSRRVEWAERASASTFYRRDAQRGPKRLGRGNSPSKQARVASRGGQIQSTVISSGHLQWTDPAGISQSSIHATPSFFQCSLSGLTHPAALRNIGRLNASNFSVPAFVVGVNLTCASSSVNNSIMSINNLPLLCWTPSQQQCGKRIWPRSNASGLTKFVKCNVSRHNNKSQVCKA